MPATDFFEWMAFYELEAEDDQAAVDKAVEKARADATAAAEKAKQG